MRYAATLRLMLRLPRCCYAADFSADDSRPRLQHRRRHARRRYLPSDFAFTPALPSRLPS